MVVVLCELDFAHVERTNTRDLPSFVHHLCDRARHIFEDGRVCTGSIVFEGGMHVCVGRGLGGSYVGYAHNLSTPACWSQQLTVGVFLCVFESVTSIKSLALGTYDFSVLHEYR